MNRNALAATFVLVGLVLVSLRIADSPTATESDVTAHLTPTPAWG